MTEATRDLFMEWFQRFGATLRDDEYEGIIEALVEHDRQVAERAWRDGYYAGKRDYAGSITGGLSISTPNPHAKGEQSDG